MLQPKIHRTWKGVRDTASIRDLFRDMLTRK
jgi:hypothetical protein